jgi:hypothetical protein
VLCSALLCSAVGVAVAIAVAVAVPSLPAHETGVVVAVAFKEVEQSKKSIKTGSNFCNQIYDII